MLFIPETALVVPKGVRIKLSDNFYSTEFDCHCTHPDCEETIIDMVLVDRCERYRALRRSGFTPLSAFRCAKHNKDIGGATASSHLMGEAIDAEYSGHPHELYWFCHLFSGVGDGIKIRNMLHGDIGHKQFSLWTYKSTEKKEDS